MLSRSTTRVHGQDKRAVDKGCAHPAAAVVLMWELKSNQTGEKEREREGEGEREKEREREREREGGREGRKGGKRGRQGGRKGDRGRERDF